MSKTVPQRREEAGFVRKPDVCVCANCKHLRTVVWSTTHTCHKLGDMAIRKGDITAICNHWVRA